MASAECQESDKAGKQTHRAQVPGDMPKENPTMARVKAAAQVPGDMPDDVLPATEPVVPPAQPKAELPNAADIDPNTIARAVLTKDGYVCPAPKPIPLSRY